MNNMEKMLQNASKQLKTTPQELKDLIKKGDMKTIMSKMESKDAEKLKNAMGNPDIVKNMSEQMKKMNQK